MWASAADDIDRSQSSVGSVSVYGWACLSVLMIDETLICMSRCGMRLWKPSTSLYWHAHIHIHTHTYMQTDSLKIMLIISRLYWRILLRDILTLGNFSLNCSSRSRLRSCARTYGLIETCITDVSQSVSVFVSESTWKCVKVIMIESDLKSVSVWVNVRLASERRLMSDRNIHTV